MKITRASIISGQIRTLDLPVTEDQLHEYGQGMLLQDAFPQLTPPQREFIKTGITAEEWKSEVVGDNGDVWYVDEAGNLRISGTDVIVATLANTEHLLGERESAINAALIVSAPKLLAACYMAFDYLTDSNIAANSRDDNEDTVRLRNALEEVIAEIIVR